MERDEETGLEYHSARYYAPWLGRWIAADPGRLKDGVNLYAYVGNNPMRTIDPTGTAGELPLDDPEQAEGNESTLHTEAEQKTLNYLKGLPPDMANAIAGSEKEWNAAVAFFQKQIDSAKEQEQKEVRAWQERMGPILGLQYSSITLQPAQLDIHPDIRSHAPTLFLPQGPIFSQAGSPGPRVTNQPIPPLDDGPPSIQEPPKNTQVRLGEGNDLTAAGVEEPAMAKIIDQVGKSVVRDAKKGFDDLTSSGVGGAIAFGFSTGIAAAVGVGLIYGGLKLQSTPTPAGEMSVGSVLLAPTGAKVPVIDKKDQKASVGIAELKIQPIIEWNLPDKNKFSEWGAGVRQIQFLGLILGVNFESKFH